MSTIMLSIGNFINIFANVTDCFAGSYRDDNAEIRKMRSELHHEDIPSPYDDRQNLKKDAVNVAGDYRKAYESKKEELSL